MELAQRARPYPCWACPCTDALVLNVDDWLGAWLGAAGGAFGGQPVAIQGGALHGWPGEAALSTLLCCGQEPERCINLPSTSMPLPTAMHSSHCATAN